jgi:multidrug efflux pump subunit AcrA (membrane-fusion protein)
LSYVPIEVPFTLDSAARVLPIRQWVLTQAADGTLSAVVYDHRTGMVRRQEGYQFDRGDQVQLLFQENWQAGTRVKAGDAVATIASSALSEQLVQLKNQLAVEQANLGVVASGQKPQVLAQLEEEIRLAQDDVTLRRKALERAASLQAEGLIAALAVEQAENALHDAQARVRLAEKSMAISATGEKQEIVAATSARIASLQKQIEFLENKRSKYVIKAPFAGTVRQEHTLEGDRLLIEDTTKLILQMPIRLRDAQYLRAGQELTLRWLDQSSESYVKALEIGQRVETLGYEQVVTLKAQLEPIDDPVTLKYTAGAAVRCHILCESVRVSEFLRRSLRWQM